MCLLTRIYSSKITVLDLIKIFSTSKCKIYHWCISVDIYNVWFLFGLCVSYPLELMNKLYELINSFRICFMLIFVLGVWDRTLYRSDPSLLSGFELQILPPPCSTAMCPHSGLCSWWILSMEADTICMLHCTPQLNYIPSLSCYTFGSFLDV